MLLRPHVCYITASCSCFRLHPVMYVAHPLKDGEGFFRCSTFQISPRLCCRLSFLGFSSLCAQTVCYFIKSLLRFPLWSCHLSSPPSHLSSSRLLFNPFPLLFVRVHIVSFFPPELRPPLSDLHLVTAPSDVRSVLSVF